MNTLETTNYPRLHEYGLIIHNDPRLHRIEAEPMDDTCKLPRLPSSSVVQMSNLIVDLTTRTYVKNRWESNGVPSDTVILMFQAVEMSSVLAVKS